MSEHIVVDTNEDIPNFKRVESEFKKGGLKVLFNPFYIFDDDVDPRDRDFYTRYMKINRDITSTPSLREYNSIGPNDIQSYENWKNGESRFCSLWAGGSGKSNWWLYTHIEEDGSLTYWKGYNSISDKNYVILRRNFVYIQVTRRQIEDIFRYYKGLEKIIHDTSDPDIFIEPIHITHTMVNDIILKFTAEEYNSLLEYPFPY